MPKRAKYNGPFEAVDVDLQDGRWVNVQQGHLLPTEVDGKPVPASVRDDLLSREDWSEVEQSNTSTKKEN